MKTESISQVIGDMLGCGASQNQIQRETGIPQPRINRWLHEGSKVADDALKLVELRKKYTRKKAKSAKAVEGAK